MAEKQITVKRATLERLLCKLNLGLQEHDWVDIEDSIVILCSCLDTANTREMRRLRAELWELYCNGTISRTEMQALRDRCNYFIP